MLFSDENFTPEAEWMIEEFFEKYSTDGQMNKQQCCDYIYQCTWAPVKPAESRVK